MSERFDIAVVGGGLAGMVATLAFADRGFDVVLVAPDMASAPKDERTTALMDQSISFLDSLGVWTEVAPHAAALSTMQIIDGTERLLRGPTVAFRASEIGLPAFGYNIPNAPFLAVLADRIAASDRITRQTATVESAVIEADKATLVLSDGSEIEAGLVVGADGRNSIIRQSAGIDVRRWTYPQTAMVMVFNHTVPHHNVSTEFHTPYGPFTQVPLPGNRSSLVWVVRPEDAENFMVLSPEALGLAVEKRMQSMLGKVAIEGKVQAWPLSGMTANRFGKGAAILVGEAGHVFPPIGAQGLNLSLRDIMAATRLVDESLPKTGSLAIGDAFNRARRTDVVARTTSVDLLNRSLLSDFMPIQMIRAAGLHVLSSLTPLRHAVMREGIQPGQAFAGLPQRLRNKIGRKQA